MIPSGVLFCFLSILDKLAQHFCRAMKRLGLLLGEVQLDHLFDAAPVEDGGNAAKYAVYSILPFQQCGNRYDAIFIVEDRLDDAHTDHISSRISDDVKMGTD